MLYCSHTLPGLRMHEEPHQEHGQIHLGHARRELPYPDVQLAQGPSLGEADVALDDPVWPLRLSRAQVDLHAADPGQQELTCHAAGAEQGILVCLSEAMALQNHPEDFRWQSLQDHRVENGADRIRQYKPGGRYGVIPGSLESRRVQ